jgi:hypothetical protein
LTTPACPVRDQLKFEAEKAVMGIAGLERVEAKMDAEVPKARGVIDKSEIAGIKHIVAVSSGKGVGKSTVSGQPCRLTRTERCEGRHSGYGRLWSELPDHDGRPLSSDSPWQDDRPAGLITA